MLYQNTEVGNLLNPAFCSLIYASIVDGYNSKNKKSIPIYMPYILLPIVLHRESREKIPNTSITKFHLWIQSEGQIVMGLDERIKRLKPFVSNSSMFLFGQGLLCLDDDYRLSIKNQKKTKQIINKAEYVAEYTRSAKVLGAICGKFDSDSTILALLGVKL